MQEGELDRRGERSARNRMRASRYAHFYYGLPGLKRRFERPLRDETLWRTVEILESVRIANPLQIAKSYPFELSGGMLQRVMIAMALAPEPTILMADEPTTALDVTVQAQILALMRDLKERIGTSIVLITHDLAVLAEVADRVCIMYAGEIVENAPIERLFSQPLHPYTQGLLASIPRFDRPDKRLESIPGSVPNLITPPTGCKFHPRCSFAMPICKESRPPMTDEGDDHSVACFLYHGTPVVE
jgi:oligopeptide/dipeptide ABC transporter ATP-binding protein